MNKIILSKILIFFVLIFSFSIVSAEFKTSKVSSDNVEFSWEPVANVFIYKILYGLDSSKTVAYPQESDYIEKNPYTLYDLTSETKYYFTLVGYDETGKEIYKSSEISASTIDKKIVNFDSLFIEDAIQVTKNKIELVFSNEISDSSNYEREFKIENVKNANDTFDVIETSISLDNKKRLLLTLDKEPVIGQEYKVIVLNIRDINDQNIEFGVNSEATFKGVEITEEQEQKFILENKFKSLDIVSIDNNQDNSNTSTNLVNSTTKNEDETKIDQNETNTEEVIKNEAIINTIESGNLAGVELNSAGLPSNVLSEAEDTSKLPATGPEQAIFLIIALIFAGILFAYKFKRI